MSKKQVFTKEEARELGISLELLNKWQSSMDIIWSFLLAYTKKDTTSKVEAIDNRIVLNYHGEVTYNIGCFFLNSSYIELKIEKENDKEFGASLSHIDQYGREGIIRCLSAIITFSNSGGNNTKSKSHESKPSRKTRS